MKLPSCGENKKFRFEGGRKGIEIEVGLSDVIFNLETEKIRFPIYDLEISMGGASDRLIYFKHPKFPDITFYTTDKKILKDPNLHYHDHAKQSVKQVNKKRIFNWSVLAGIVGFFALIILCIFLFRKQMVMSVAEQVPPQWEREIGDKLFSQVTLGRHMIEDSALIAELTKTMQPLVKAVDDTSFHFKFYIVEDPTLNAFALPGGNIVIHSGLIAKSSSWEELTGVLGHEIAHVTQRHHLRGIISNLGIFAVLSAVIGDATAIFGTLANAGGSLSSLMYSREYETESDEKGWEYLMKANINPTGMISFFKKLQKEYPEAKDTEEITEILSTHPATQERIDNLTAKEKDIKGIKFTAFSNSFDTFKKQLKTDLDKE
ncbi:MAG: M48 family metallopeptidase [Bacteroidetes bacterium]|nr:M48 family metallopeptidase [Bacteroidota bacterium]